MDSFKSNLDQPELMKYLHGKISFETWLSNQNLDSQMNGESSGDLLIETVKDAYNTLNPVANINIEDDASIFTSWGSAFTSKQEDGTVESAVVPEEMMESCDDDFEVVRCETDTLSHLKLRPVALEKVPPFNPDDKNPLQCSTLVPLMKDLPDIILSSKRFAKSKPSYLDEEQEFDDFPRKKRGGGRGRSSKKLPEMARLQLGQANLLIAKKDFKRAAEICMEIVKEAPTYGMPFRTLAFIYEEQGDKELALQYTLIAAFLDCKDHQEWKDLAQRCVNEGSESQCLACYNQACKVLPSDAGLQWDRATLYFEKRDCRKTLDIISTILKVIVPKKTHKYMHIAKEVATLYHKVSSTDRAKDTLLTAFKRCGKICDHEAVNLLCEMFISAAQYNKAIQLIADQCDVSVPSQSNESESARHLSTFLNTALTNEFKEIPLNLAENIASESVKKVLEGNNAVESADLVVPEEFPLDLRIKLSVCLIHLHRPTYVEEIMKPLFFEDLTEVGDLLLDVTDAYFETENYNMALKYYLELVECEHYNQAAVWLRIAECFSFVDTEKSIEAYYMVIALVPLHTSARVTLAGLLKDVGRIDEAKTILSEYDCTPEEETGTQVVNEVYKLKADEFETMYKKCLMLYGQNKMEDFLSEAYVLTHNYLLWDFNYQKQMLIGKAQMWLFLLKVLNVATELEQYDKAIKLVNKAVLFKPYSESKKYRLELQYLQTTIYLVAGDYHNAFASFRFLIQLEGKENVSGSTPLWNLFGLIANKMMDKRHHRFILRRLFQNPETIPLLALNANNSHIAGNYKYAIGEYSHCFRAMPHEPLWALMLGLSYIHLSCQRFHKTRHLSVTQGMVFLFHYKWMRKNSQEAFYNLGRAFHQIGLVNYAVFFYNKALGFPLHNEKNSSKKSEIEYHPFLDLHREAACNLSLIYKESGNKELARSILHKYCWV